MTRSQKWFQLVLATSVMGTTFQLGAGCLSRAAQMINPCGTILNCDPLEYDLAFQDWVPDWDLDPTCTIPGMCGGTPFPPGGAVGIDGGA